MLHSIVRDIRYGARSLRKSPALLVIAVLALTLGIGLTTTMFSIVYGALLKGLPFADADRLVLFRRPNLDRAHDGFTIRVHDLEDYRGRSRSFEALSAFYSGTVNVSGTEKAERYDGAFVTSNVFDLLGVRPVLGRGFLPGEDRADAAKVAVISWAMWHNRFAGDPGVIGTTLRANGVPYVVVGVMPEKFTFPNNDLIWLPLGQDATRLKRGAGAGIDVMGKLRAGTSIDQANAELAGLGRQLATEFKETNERAGLSVQPFVDAQMGPEPRQLLYTMLGAVFFVLLIACANVANLLLDRAAHRTREVGVRTALGASRGAVVRQFLTEALVLSLTGAVFGVIVAWAGVVLFNRAIADTQVPFWIDIRLHPPVLLFVVGVAAVTSLLSGAIPAYQSSRADISEILKDESRGASSFRIGRLSRGLVIFEIALSCGLLVAAGLMIKTVARLRNMNPGFATANVFTARLGFPAQYTDTLKQAQFYDDLAARLAELPGVEVASISSGLPAVNMGGSNFALEGKAYTQDRDYPHAPTQSVMPAFFRTFAVSMLEGRNFGPQDRRDAPPVAIVNQAFVRAHLAGQSPLGHRIRFGGARSTDRWRTIVGVVPDLYTGDQQEPFGPAIYTPLAQNHVSFVSIALRTSGAGDPMRLTPRVRETVSALDRDIPIYWVYAMREAVARPTWFVRVFGTLFMVFGFVALFLAAVGLYAVMAFSVSRRTREVGIRMALGAQAGHVVRMIFRQGAWQLGIGLTAGIGLAAGVSQLMKVVLFDVQPRDPVVFTSVILVLLGAGMAACYVPARRATRVDPLMALRAD